jgi:hypothetical protein
VRERTLRLRGSITATLAVGIVIAVPASVQARALQDASPPLPGGKYAGATKLDERVRIRVSTDGPNGSIAGKLKLPCAQSKARFRTADGSFVAKRRNSHGRLILAAKGRFTSPTRVRGRLTEVAGKRHCAPSRFNARLHSPAGVRSKAIDYGPFDVPPGGMQTTRNDVARPCSDCYVLAMVPDLVYANGKVANFDTDAMLHHVVLFNTAATDATCPNTGVGNLGQRFFASGNERTIFTLPSGYGYHVSPDDKWRLLTHLMNMADHNQSYYIRVTFFYIKAPASVNPVTPVWLDINNCGDSEYSIPVGRSDTHWDYRVPAALAGKLVSIGGHQHNDSVKIKATDGGRTLCTSRAGYGRNPSYMGNIESMSGCVGDPLARIHAGDTIRLHSIYDTDHAQNDVMGIMLAYVATTGGG